MIAKLASRYSQASRRRKAKRITDYIEKRRVTSVLFVGAESADFPWSNIVENAVLDTGSWVVMSGLGPNLNFTAPRVFCDGRALPFANDSFDLVISNAVVEHVGAKADQERFVAEHARVGRAFMITTPNRWFPVESHTRTLFRHWSHTWRQRQGEHFTRLLSRGEFVELLPPGTAVSGGPLSPTFFAESR